MRLAILVGRMMRSGLLSAVLAFAVVPVHSQPADEIATSCADADDTLMCERDAIAFRIEVTRAWSGDYAAQRIVANCLANSCRGSVQTDRMLACAWRMVILHSGSAEVDLSDSTNLRFDCVNGLRKPELAVAADKAMKIYREVYKKDMPAFEVTSR